MHFILMAPNISELGMDRPRHLVVFISHIEVTFRQDLQRRACNSGCRRLRPEDFRYEVDLVTQLRIQNIEPTLCAFCRLLISSPNIRMRVSDGTPIP